MLFKTQTLLFISLPPDAHIELLYPDFSSFIQLFWYRMYILLSYLRREEFTKTTLHHPLHFLTPLISWWPCQIVFFQDNCIKLSHPSSDTAKLSCWDVEYVFLPWFSQAFGNSRIDATWLLRVGNKRQNSFLMILLGCSFLERSHHALRKPRAQGEVMCRCSSQQIQLRS